MDYSEVQEYWEAIDMIEAQDLLHQVTVSCFPKYSKKDRSKLRKQLEEKAFFPETMKVTTTGDLMKVLKKEGFLKNG